MKGFIVLLLLSFISVVSGQQPQNYSQYLSSDDKFLKDNISEQSENQIGWEKLYPFPIDGYIQDFVVQENLLILISTPEFPEDEEFSEIYKSVDSSNTWSKMPAPRRTYLSSIKMSENIIYISGYEKNGTVSEGVIYRSDDLGESWVRCLQFGSQSIKNIFPFSADEITVSLFKSDDTLHILHSSDGGIVWDIRSCKIPLQTVKYVQFIDRQNGWIAGNRGLKDYILRTINGGISWDSLHEFPGSSFGAMYMSDSLKGFMIRSASGDNVHKTTDGGISWQLMYSLGISNQTRFLSVVDSLHIYFLHSYDGQLQRRLYKSTDGGNSWNYNMIDFYEPVGRLWFAAPAEAWISGYNGILRKSVDGGITWINQTKTLTDMNQTEISFCDTQNGWMITEKNYLLSSNDGGITWGVKLKDSIYTYFDVLLLNESTGFIISNYTYYYRGRISKTTDGGNTWYSTNLNSLLLFKVFFADSLNGWVIGEHDYVHSINYPYILKTSDGGLNWSRQTNIDFHTTEYRLPTNGIHFTDADNGWCVGKYGTIVRTTNGGNSWITRRGGLGDSLFWKNYDMSDVFFINHNNGFVVGMYNYDQMLVLKTSDSGESWDTTTLEGYGSYELFFRDENTGFLLGGMNGKSYSTTDGGKSWFLINDIKYVNGACAYSNYIWTVGPAGRLYRYTGTPLLTADEPNYFAAGYNLEQNYPNPFNPSTKIRFSVEGKQKVLLKVYDSIGRHIDTLFDGVAEKGMHEVVFDNKTLASGVYFYVLFAGENKAAKKMIILK